MTSTVQDPLIGRTIGGYELLDLVGSGGMGTVYRARAVGGQIHVAVKLLRLDRLDDLRDVQRFRREAEIAADLIHPNIVSVFESGSEDGFLYMCMELIEGQALRQVLRQRGHLPVDQAMGIATQILEALQEAHDHDIIHRDIKAENVLLQEDGTAKVLDFGVAKVQSATVLTQANEILGTVEYMAPEQILGDPVGPATDLYAAGVLLYEMLTGSLPFTGDAPATLVYHQLNEEPQAPSMLNEAVNRPLDRFVLGLLDKLPENRPPSAADALVVLREIRRRHDMLDLDIPDAERSADEIEETELRTRDFRPRFIGRQSEVNQLDSHLDQLKEGGRVVFLEGEAGIGKSRLVEEMGRRALQRGVRLVTGRCFFEHGMGPYMPFLDALGDLFGGTADPLSDDERQQLAAILQEKAPELADLAASSTTTAKVQAGFTAAFAADADPDSGRQRLFDTVFDVLAAAAALRPLVIVLDDMHWADDGSLQLLGYIQRRAAEAALLCLPTYESESLTDDAPLNKTLKQLEIDGQFHSVQLQRLQRDAIGQLARSLFLEAEFSDDFIDYLYDQSQGNPFIAVEILKLLRQQKVLYCETGVWTTTTDFVQTGIPERVNALIMRRIDQLDDELRELFADGRRHRPPLLLRTFAGGLGPVAHRTAQGPVQAPKAAQPAALRARLLRI